MARKPFKLRSGNSPLFKDMGSSPTKHWDGWRNIHKHPHKDAIEDEPINVDDPVENMPGDDDTGEFDDVGDKVEITPGPPVGDDKPIEEQDDQLGIEEGVEGPPVTDEPIDQPPVKEAPVEEAPVEEVPVEEKELVGETKPVEKEDPSTKIVIGGGGIGEDISIEGGGSITIGKQKKRKK